MNRRNRMPCPAPPPRSRRNARSIWNLPAGATAPLTALRERLRLALKERSHNSFLAGITPFQPCRLSPSSVPNVINEEVGLALNRAKPIHVVLHLLVSVALLVMASVVVAQSNRTSAPRRTPTAAAPKVPGNANPASATSKSANPASGTRAAGASGTLR